MSTLSFSNTFKTITAAAVLSLSAPLTAVAVPSAETSADEIGDLDALLHNSQDDSELSAGVVNGNESLSWREGGISTSVPHNPAEMAKTTIDGQDMLEIGLLHPETVSEGVVTSNNTVIFPAQDSPDTYAMQLYDNGSLGLTAIAVTPESEGQFAYDLPSSITPVVQQTGAVALYEDDSLIGVVEHPEAYDADGNAIVTKYVDVDGDLVQVVSPQARSAYPLVARARVGVFKTGGDYVHVSKRAGYPRQASGHGWWIKGTTRATKAVVTVHLQVKPNSNSGWRDRGKSGVRKLGPGSSKRANARVTCRSHAKKQWRSWVDVDLIGYLDTPNRLYTSKRTIKCSP